MENRKVIVLSADALTDADMALLKKLPNFSRLYARASGVESVRSIYPSITYPVHVTIATGVYPDRHGVCDNSELHIGMKNMPWQWFHKAVKAEDIFTLAKKNGRSTAAVFWPVTGNHPDIDYLVDEYWPQSPEQTPREAFLSSGTTEQVMRDTLAENMRGVVIRTHPQTDEMCLRCAADMIRHYQPDLLMIHPANIDHYRHQTGMFSDTVVRGVYETDAFLGTLMDAAQEAGVFDQTTFVLLSDHGQMDIRRIVNLNVILAENGLIRPRADGTPESWDAFVKSTGMSAQVYLRDPADSALAARVSDLLTHLCEEGVYGISRVYTAQEAEEEEHLAGDFSFVLETDGYTTFGDNCVRPLVTTFGSTSDYRSGHATHGYHPDKGPQPVFYAAGPAVKPGVVLTRRPIVDVAPTLARMLGLEMKNIDGTAMEEILAD